MIFLSSTKTGKPELPKGIGDIFVCTLVKSPTPPTGKPELPKGIGDLLENFPSCQLKFDGETRIAERHW